MQSKNSYKFSNLPVTNSHLTRTHIHESNFTFRNRPNHSPSPNTSIQHHSPTHLTPQQQIIIPKESGANGSQDKIVRNIPSHLQQQKVALIPHRSMVTYRQVSPQ